MKKAISLLLSAMLLLSAFCLAVSAAEEPDDTVGFSADRVVKADLDEVYNILSLDEHPEEDAYKINSAEGLVRLSNAVKNDFYTFEGVTFYITKDIDMSGVEWLPIGPDTATGNSNPSKYFAGTLDGQGHIISNLVYENKTGGDMVAVTGLFGITKGATIKNLILNSDCSFTYSGTAGDNRTGSIIGWANGSNTIDNCLSLAAVNGKNHTGGIVGQYPGSANTMLRIVNTTNAGPVTSAGAAGGIGGYMQGPLEIVNCRNAGDVSTSSDKVGDAWNAVGGIVARSIPAAAGQTARIDGCINNGTLTGGLTGGIVGAVHVVASETTVQNCINYGELKSDLPNAVSSEILGINAGNEGTEPTLTDNQERSGEEDASWVLPDVIPDYEQDDSPGEPEGENPPEQTTEAQTDDETEPERTTGPNDTTAGRNDTEAPDTTAPSEPAGEDGCQSAVGGICLILLTAGTAAFAVTNRNHRAANRKHR